MGLTAVRGPVLRRGSVLPCGLTPLRCLASCHLWPVPPRGLGYAAALAVGTLMLHRGLVLPRGLMIRRTLVASLPGPPPRPGTTRRPDHLSRLGATSVRACEAAALPLQSFQGQFC